jgi:hypothetical protein
VLKGERRVFPEALPLTENGFGIDYDKFADRGNKGRCGMENRGEKRAGS